MSHAVTYTVCESCKGLNRIAFDAPGSKLPICGRCKSALAIHDGVSDLSVATLNALTHKSPLPVIVDYWAPWCGPCRSFAPSFIEAASRLKGRAVFGKIDTQTHSSAGEMFGIKGLPTLIIFFRGREVSRTSGALPLDELTKWITEKTGAMAL